MEADIWILLILKRNRHGLSILPMSRELGPEGDFCNQKLKEMGKKREREGEGVLVMFGHEYEVLGIIDGGS